MIATRFSVGLHILVIVASDPPGGATSLRLAASIGTNPVVVRRIAGQLSRAGLITVQRGPGGAMLTRPAEAISLGDVWRAIHPAPEAMLRVHRRSPQACPLGQRIPPLLRRRFDQAEAAMMADFGKTSLADLVGEASRDLAEAAD
jgi:DNA-binding IscR family transcriptional regulator